MQDPYIGEIAMFAGGFAPEGWFVCDGRMLPIMQYQALFAVIGVTYGGDGRSTFALPDLRGRVPISYGKGVDKWMEGGVEKSADLSSYPLGGKGGKEKGTLTLNQIPPHNHPLRASSVAADKTTPSGMVLGAGAGGRTASYHAEPTDVTLGQSSIGNAGGNNATPSVADPVDNRQPYLAINFIIAWQGIFPQRP